MKKMYFLVVLMLLMGTSLQAKQIDVNKAKNIAEKFFQQQSLTRASGNDLRLAYTATDDATTRSATAAKLFYVFDRGESNGFVVVAGDDSMRPVLGYTSNGSFDINTDNEGLKWWLSAITAKAKAVANGTDKSTFTSTRASSSSVEPIVKTKWNQYSPYNNLCPADNTHGTSQTSVTGCVATAMAQVLYTCYAGTTQTLSGTVACRTTAHATSTSNVDLSQFTIDYSKMELTYDGDESDESKEAVAKLMYACGLSVNMDYCASASGSNLSSYVLMKYFGIDNGCTLAHRNQYTTDEWDNLIKGELNNGRAVLYSGADMGNAGHAFICDGYNAEGLYHINWGWGGYNDGYFDFCSLDFEYVNMQSAVCGIKPGSSSVSPVDVLSYESITTSETLPIEKATSLICKINKLSCYGSDFKGYLGLVLCNSDGTIVKSLAVTEVSYKDTYYYNFSRSLTLPSDLADGTYQLRIGAGSTADNLEVVKGTGSYSYLTLTVSNGSITVSGYQPEAAKLSIVSYTVEEDGCGYVGSTTPVTLVIKNEGGEFLGNINVDSESISKAAIKAGGTKEVTVKVTPNAEGSQSFKISATDDYSSTNYDLGEVTIEVKAASEATPKLVVESAEFKNADLTLGDSAILVVKVRNDGGKYDGYIYAEYGGSFYTDGRKYTTSGHITSVTKMEVFRGKTITMNLAIDYQNFWSGKQIECCEFNVPNVSYYYNKTWNEVALGSEEEGTVPSFKARQLQTITWDQTFDDVDSESEIDLQATASSELDVEYVITSGSEYAEIVDGKLKCKAPGTVVVEARQAGSDKYKAAESVSKTIVILEATSIEGVAAAGEISIAIAGNSLIVNGTEGGESICVYSVAGSLLKSVKAEGSTTQINGLASGHSYVVSVNGKGIKILVK